jgi:hypothetical protein
MHEKESYQTLNGRGRKCNERGEEESERGRRKRD